MDLIESFEMLASALEKEQMRISEKYDDVYGRGMIAAYDIASREIRRLLEVSNVRS